MSGWTGKLLRVNLTHGTSRVEDIPRQWLEEYVGGRGLAARYLYEEMDPAVDALSPENVLIFATGPLTGTPVPCGARYMVVTKGALTGAITTSNSGGHWGPELKFAGYDLLLLEGRAPKPAYLFIYDDRVEIRDAAHWWGKGVSETEDGLREELGVPALKVASIGPAGENLVRFACIMNDKHRAAGRSGVGAVMGSKNLKAVAVRGTGGVKVADPAAFMKSVWEIRAGMQDSPGRKSFADYGTAATIDMTQTFGGLPTRNFLQGQFEEYENLNGDTIARTRLVANKACFACTIACGRVTKLDGGSDKYLVNMHPRNWKTAGEGPEYENAWALGADTGVGDLDAVIKANWLCNDLGMDPISMGATLAAAMELYETGVVTADMVELPLRFGSAEALVRMVEATGYREGFGDELAEGSKRMGEKLRHPEVFMGSKGQEFPAYDPRGFQGMGVAYATCNRGACHLRAWTPGIESTGQAEDHALREELPDDASAAPPERGPDRQLAAPCGSAGEEQTCHVRRRDQQHEADGSEQDPERPAQAANEQGLVVQQQEAAAVAGRDLRIRLHEAGGELRHLQLGLAAAHAAAQPRHDAVVVAPVAGIDLELERHEDVRPAGRLREEEVGRHDADDLVGLAVQAESLAEDAGIGLVDRAPEVVAQDRDAGPARPVLLLAERAAERGHDPEDAVPARADAHALDLERRRARALQLRAQTLRGRDRLEGRRVLSPEVILDRREGPRPAAALPLPSQVDQPVRLRIRQRLEHHAVHHAEDRCRRADPQR
jgi:aldehyde:ferredoxin oxidoreductase